MAGPIDTLLVTQSEQTDVGNSSSSMILSANATIPSNSCKLVVGPFTINSGVQLTIGSGGRFKIESGASPFGIQIATITLNDAQIKNLPTFAVTIVPAPGANLTILPLYFIHNIDTSAGAYTGLATPSTEFTWGGITGTTMGSVVNVTTNLISAFVSVGFELPTSSGDVVTGSKATNLPLTFFVNNNSLNLTGGNAANTWKITVLYLVA